MKDLKLPKSRKIIGNASLLKRGVAFVIDIIILNWVLTLPFRKTIIESIPDTLSLSELSEHFLQNPEIVSSLSHVSFIIAILSITYFSFLEYSFGQSIGKKLLKLRVIKEQAKTKKKNDSKDIWRFIVRSVFLIPIFPLSLLWIIDPVYLFFNKNNQRLSERLSKTRVIEEFLL